MQLRVHPDTRSDQEHRHDVQGAGARRQHAAQSAGPGHAAALKPLQPSAYWGDEVIWETRFSNNQQPRCSIRKGRLWLAAAVRGPDNPSVLPRGLRAGVGQGLFPARSRVCRHLASCSIRRPRSTQFVDFACFATHHRVRQFGYDAKRHAVDEWRRAGRGLAEHQDVRRDRRRREVAGMDGARARYQRQRKARRVRRTGRATRSREGHPNRRQLYRRSCRAPRTVPCGAR